MRAQLLHIGRSTENENQFLCHSREIPLNCHFTSEPKLKKYLIDSQEEITVDCTKTFCAKITLAQKTISIFIITRTNSTKCTTRLAKVIQNNCQGQVSLV